MVLRAMHGYIKNFFGCADCADHFIEMAKEKDLFSVQTVDSAILWLWSAHNEVNKRLSGDVTEDPEFPKVQYPRKEHCEACRTSDGAWTSEEVLIYLKEKYGRSGIHYGSRENSEIVRPRREHITVSLDRTVQIKAGWDFTVFDISILVVLYVASAAILVLVCVQFAVKKSMKKRTFIQTLFRRA
uniref:Sulfhydryl oxidase n=1 Tax=Fopius arisanus TaxID=64838 RepID=A0A0C9RKX6_9HYME